MDEEERREHIRLRQRRNRQAGALPIQGIDRNRIRRIRVLESGHEVHIVTHFNYSDYPDVVFADLGEDPVLPDPVDYVLKVEVSD